MCLRHPALALSVCVLAACDTKQPSSQQRQSEATRPSRPWLKAQGPQWAVHGPPAASVVRCSPPSSKYGVERESRTCEQTATGHTASAIGAATSSLPAVATIPQHAVLEAARLGCPWDQRLAAADGGGVLPVSHDGPRFLLQHSHIQLLCKGKWLSPQSPTGFPRDQTAAKNTHGKFYPTDLSGLFIKPPPLCNLPGWNFFYRRRSLLFF
jgi:hypothetical protein